MQTKRFLGAALILIVAAACAAPDGAREDTATPAPAAAAETAAPTPAASAAGTPTKQFPGLDYLQQIPYAYRVANEHPEMLADIPCYCPCELYGHGGVIDCYRSQHAAACATCLEEAVTAGHLLEQSGDSGPQAYGEIAALVKNRYREAIVKSNVQRGEMPNLQSAGGQAYLAACSDCHQPPHPAMYTAAEWRKSLSRMEAHANQRGMDPDPQQWEAAVNYIRTTAGQFPADTGEKYRASLASAVAHLKVAEGESVYYPSSRDKVLDPEWFERMVQAYRLARDIPAEVLAATPVDDPNPACNNLLQCLNTTAAVTSEAAVEAVYRIVAEGAGG